MDGEGREACLERNNLFWLLLRAAMGPGVIDKLSARKIELIPSAFLFFVWSFASLFYLS